jgi:AcrR family transcriptional regulator
MARRLPSNAARSAYAPGTRDRLLAAAIAEFAARGFDGATVDRIAARARVNKAMLYYHFRHKAGLYGAILRQVFGDVAASVARIPTRGEPPDVQLRRYIETVATEAVAKPHFPALWLREMAEGGRHLTAPVVAEMSRVIEALTAILRAGERAGVFRRVNPFATHITIVSPLLMFAASAAARRKFAGRLAPGSVGIDRAGVVRYVQESTLAALAPTAPRRKGKGRSR